MKYLFKIYSGYDGFRPGVIEERLDADGHVPLGWTRYIESVEIGDEVWVYFRGPHSFRDGIYIRGLVVSVEVKDLMVYLEPTDLSTSEPLSGEEATRHARAAIAARGRQVFLLPEELVGATCDIDGPAISCSRRSCLRCPTWQALAAIESRSLSRPHRLGNELAGYCPAYWVIPPRSFIYMGGRYPADSIRRSSELFKRFKTGAAELAHPLSLGIHDRMTRDGLGEFDTIVPIPLSPEKEARGEIHRTRLLARQLGRLASAPVREALWLERPISKRQLKVLQGMGDAEFEAEYYAACAADATATGLGRVLLVDDVCTEGSTLTAAARSLVDADPHCEIVAVTAGQMVVRDAVAIEDSLLQ